MERQAEEEEMAKKALEDFQKREHNRKENDDIPSDHSNLDCQLKMMNQ